MNLLARDFASPPAPPGAEVPSSAPSVDSEGATVVGCCWSSLAASVAAAGAAGCVVLESSESLTGTSLTGGLSVAEIFHHFLFHLHVEA